MTTGTTLNKTAIDNALDDLHGGAPAWVALPLNEKVALLDALPFPEYLSPRYAAERV
jgi:hypothetical protein